MTATAVRHDDVVVLLDGDGRPAGTAPRSTVHTTDTPLHLAFSAYLVGPDGRLLLTRRALTKATWPGVWTNSACGHPRPGEDPADAVRRRVREELGVDLDDVVPLLPDFRYRAVDATGTVEHEVCPVYAARIADPSALRLDPAEVMEHAWVDWADVVAIARTGTPVLSPWSQDQVRRIHAAGADPVRVLDAPPASPGPADSSVPTAPSAASSFPPVEDTLAAVENELDRQLTRLAATWPAAAPDVLDADLAPWLARTVNSGGKRFRPTMCHWGYVAGGGRAEAPGLRHVVELGAALELLHTFALVHDDVMDASPTRRGAPSAHVVASDAHRVAGAAGSADRFGTSLAVLLGDLAHVEADRIVGELPGPLRERWYELCVELIAGQRADLTGSAALRRDERHARDVARMKSGGYTVTQPLLLGAAAAEAPPAVDAALTAYGDLVGTAFAFRDDLLGVWGDPAQTGKPAGDDLVDGKPTIVLALGSQVLTGAAADALGRVGTPAARAGDVPLLQDALAEAGVRDRVEALIRESVDAALDALDPRVLTADGIAGLTRTAEHIAWRDL